MTNQTFEIIKATLELLLAYLFIQDFFFKISRINLVRYKNRT